MFEAMFEKMQEKFERGEDYLSEKAERNKLIKYLVLPFFHQLWFYTYIVFSPFGLMVAALLFIGSIHRWAN